MRGAGNPEGPEGIVATQGDIAGIIHTEELSINI